MDRKDRDNYNFSYSDYYKEKSQFDLDFNKKLRTLKKLENQIEKELSGFKKTMRAFENFKPKKSLVFLGSILLIVLIFLGIYYFTKPSAEAKFNPIDIVVSNSTASVSLGYNR